jgi:hypothetical protein
MTDGSGWATATSTATAPAPAAAGPAPSTGLADVMNATTTAGTAARNNFRRMCTNSFISSPSIVAQRASREPVCDRAAVRGAKHAPNRRATSLASSTADRPDDHRRSDGGPDRHRPRPYVRHGVAPRTWLAVVRNTTTAGKAIITAMRAMRAIDFICYSSRTVALTLIEFRYSERRSVPDSADCTLRPTRLASQWIELVIVRGRCLGPPGDPIHIRYPRGSVQMVSLVVDPSTGDLATS